MSKQRVLIIDDELHVRHSLGTLLSSEEGGYEVASVSTAQEGLDLAQKEYFDHILTDIYMKPQDGIEFLKAAKKAGIKSNIIMMSGMADTSLAIKALNLGAVDYIHKPITAGQLFFVLRKAEERTRLKKENQELRKALQKECSFHNMVAKSDKMIKIFRIIEKVADYKTTVLITGESGTGKELVAKALHFNSIRKKAPFIGINCGGIPENLLESELFGHVKGAFTDAIRAKKGYFEEADGGTLFLDELGELPLTLQVKLLRALQEEEIRPLGDTRSIKIDVRIIAATAKDLEQAVKKGQFREDLYYRINVLSINMPPLRERKEDIPLLVEHYRKEFNKRLNKDVKSVSNEVMHLFLNYNWPGNIRELGNVMERAIVLTENSEITIEDIPHHICEDNMKKKVFSLSQTNEDTLSIKKSSRLLESELIKKALKKTEGNKTKAARLLEISLPALLYKIKEYGIEAPLATGN